MKSWSAPAVSIPEKRPEQPLSGLVCDIVLVRSSSASNPSDGTFELREYTHRWTDDYSANSVTLYAEDYHDIYESSYGEVKRYNLEIPFDENGNPLGTLTPTPYEEASDMRLMAVEYNEDNALKMLLMTAEGFDTGYPFVAFEWNDGNIVSMRPFGEEPITVTPSVYTAPGGLDFNLFFLGTALSTIRDIILTPPTNLGKWSRNLPEAMTDGTYDDSITKFEYEFDQYGRLTKASEIPEQYNSRYTFYYDEQPAPALEELDYIQNYPNE